MIPCGYCDYQGETYEEFVKHFETHMTDKSQIDEKFKSIGINLPDEVLEDATWKR